MGTSKHPYFVTCITAGDKQREGRSVQIHTTRSTATLQNRRCSSVAVRPFLVLQASCPPYNLVIYSDSLSGAVPAPGMLRNMLQVEKFEI